MNEIAPRRIWLCADDYGLSPGVNRAIRDLIERGRLNATSVMVVGPAIGRDEVSALRTVAGAGPLRRLDPEIIQAELRVQLTAFKDLFGRAPDFVDGHQHAQLFPQVRDAFLAAVKEAAPDAWVRQGGRHQPLSRRLGAPKALFLDLLSAQFRRRAARASIAFNPGFAGAYDFSRQPDFGVLMSQFLDGLPGKII